MVSWGGEDTPDWGIARHVRPTVLSECTVNRTYREKVHRVNTLSGPPLHPAELHAVRQIVQDIANLLTIAGGHIALTLQASVDHPVNRAEELQAASEASNLAIRLAKRLAHLIGPDVG